MVTTNGDDRLALYLQLIRAAQPDLKIESVRLNDEGMVNDVLIINEARVFRFPKHEWAFDDMLHEARCLALARQYVSLRLPEWTVHEDAFVSYDWIPGVALQRHAILRQDEATQEALAEQLGTFLTQLHAIPMAEVAESGIQPSVTNRTRERWLQLYEDVQRELFPHLMQFQQDWARLHFQPLIEDASFMAYEPCLMDGDLGPYHLLYDPDAQRLTGMLDLGTAGSGDPATDFACLLDQYGESFVRRVGRYYPDVTGLIDRARFWAGTMELQWALGGLRNPEEPIWSLAHLGRARDVGLIGSGW
jgi:aminoglycoside 2''-phosphotransferase